METVFFSYYKKILNYIELHIGPIENNKLYIFVHVKRQSMAESSIFQIDRHMKIFYLPFL
jgi:hypothetical protein